MMNSKYKFVRLVVAAAFGSLLWAGCASERTYYTEASADFRPMDLTERRAHTHPEWQSGLEKNAGWDSTVDVPGEAPTVIESAGAARP